MVIPIDKPLGWTSFDVTNKIRSHLRYRYNIPLMKVGHAGTLDPLATGLLLICVGKKTKAISGLQELQKTYTGTIRLGETTPSLDAETEISELKPTEHVTAEMLDEAAKNLSGRLMQVPPVFSAIKLHGKRAYKMARKDQTIDLPARPVTIYSFLITGYSDKEVCFEITCSRGTYIRAIARDLGNMLGTCAYLTSLRRIKTGSYSIEDAFSMDDFDKALSLLRP